jgi:hypothetical protein
MFCMYLSTAGKQFNRIVRVTGEVAVCIATGKKRLIDPMFLRPTVPADWQL